MRQKLVRIDLTPLVDVVFLLLIFFMVSTTFREEQGLELRLPEARSSTPAQNEDVLRVSVGRDGSIRFRGESLDPQALELAVGAAMADSENRQVIVEADKQVAHGVVVQVMDALRRAGARGLTVGTQPPAQ
jgi:biopolymer transport protein ExbD